MPVTVDLEKCVGSRDCLNACAFNAIEVQNGKAVIFENCVDCDACVRACPTHAIISSTAPEATSGGALIVDFADRSGIVAVSERAVKRAGTTSTGLRVDPSNAGAAADALATYVKENTASLVVLPHHGAGPVVAARLAHALGASLLAGCSDLALDDSGDVRATRLCYGGIVKTASRVGAGTTVVTLVPRGSTAFAAQELDGGRVPERAGDAPAAPPQLARAIVAVGAALTPDALTAARACAQTLGAPIVEAASLSGAQLAPELLIAIGVEGSTEQNAAMRGAGTIVAAVENPGAPIALIADYVLVGNVADQAMALCAAL
jgi:electron transfer flavoprotein alpha subunit/NAD-dependent dihydropyrimidine dehydrogenase PreA subunit